MREKKSARKSRCVEARKRQRVRFLIEMIVAITCATVAWSQGGAVGLFEGHQDVGKVLHPGSTVYDAGKQSYTVTGSGENMWFGMDDFQFAWEKMTGDAAISADISFVGDKGDNHRKAVLMIRQ